MKSLGKGPEDFEGEEDDNEAYLIKVELRALLHELAQLRYDFAVKNTRSTVQGGWRVNSTRYHYQDYVEGYYFAKDSDIEKMQQLTMCSCFRNQPTEMFRHGNILPMSLSLELDLLR
ncbi:hypothetical protein BDZ97DRAFT_1755456 [Flammula alnicola]|nr:hypothetical protein BDZ97DRAFT_1755456 [Flammula alnicola]